MVLVPVFGGPPSSPKDLVAIPSRHRCVVVRDRLVVGVGLVGSLENRRNLVRQDGTPLAQTSLRTWKIQRVPWLDLRPRLVSCNRWLGRDVIEISKLVQIENWCRLVG